MKPPFPYYGAKQSIADRIVAAMPPHVHYVEPFCGSLAVLLAKPPVRMETVNDLDGELMNFWKMLRDYPDALARACALTPHSRSEYLAARDYDDAPTDLEAARRTWVRLTQGRAGTLRQSLTGWRHFVAPRGSSIGMPDYLMGYVERMARAAERLHHVSLEALPALDLIVKYGQDPETLLYVDPPYLGSTRSWGNNYKHELRTENEHRALAEALGDCAAVVVLSGYPSALYEELYADWDHLDLQATTGNGGHERARVEVLWSNRPLTAQQPLFALGGPDA